MVRAEVDALASNGNESGGAQYGKTKSNGGDGVRREMPSAGRRCSRAEQTDEARAKRTSGDWFLAKARSRGAGAGEDEARATRSAEERRASRASLLRFLRSLLDKKG